MKTEDSFSWYKVESCTSYEAPGVRSCRVNERELSGKSNDLGLRSSCDDKIASL